MQPIDHTLYAVCLYFSLVSLLMWSHRRHNLSRRIQKGIGHLAGD